MLQDSKTKIEFIRMQILKATQASEMGFESNDGMHQPSYLIVYIPILTLCKCRNVEQTRLLSLALLIRSHWSPCQCLDCQNDLFFIIVMQ